MPDTPLIKAQTSFPLVPSEKIAFAMAVFVNTANQAIRPQSKLTLGVAAGRARDQLFLDLLPRGPAQVQIGKPQETSLYEAFMAVWEQFEGDDQQQVVCVRILAFHFLMLRTQGSVVEEWLRPSPENPETVILDDAIVAAVGSVDLGNDGSLLEDRFLSAVRTQLLRRTDDRSALGEIIRIGNGERLASQKPAPIGFVYRDVAAQLIAYQAKTAGTSQDELAVISKICEKLSLSLSALIGKEASRALLLRALALARRENAACATLRVTDDGAIGGTCEESTSIGVTLVGHLLNGPAILIGEALVRSMLHKEWPELSLSGPPRDELQTAN